MQTTFIIFTLYLLVFGRFAFNTQSHAAETTTMSEKPPEARLPCQSSSGIRVNTSDRLRRLRERISFYDYGAYIIPTDDEHQSEYPAEHDKRRQYITGFTGSAGTAVVLRDKGAALWVDGRYHIQAEQEADCNWQIMKMVEANTPAMIPWIISSLNTSHSKWVGADPRLIPQDMWSQWQNDLSAAGLTLIANSTNLIDDIWTTSTGRPPEPSNKVFVHPTKYSGLTWQEKVKMVRDDLTAKKLDALVITDLAEVAWLLNLRGSDISYVPVFKSFVFVTFSEIRLYIKQSKLTGEVQKHLGAENTCDTSATCEKVQFTEYGSVYGDLAQRIKTLGLKVTMARTASHAIYNTAPEDMITLDQTATRRFIVIKNKVEDEGMKKAMFRDSVVLADFFSMLESEILEGRKWDEIEAAKAIDDYRKKSELNRGPSFMSISAFGPNAGLPHYQPSPSTNRVIDQSSLYLLDSGGQYLDGTTDVTRTVHFGTPTVFQKEAYTRVLQGHISLANLVFPKGTTDSYVELPARMYLYNNGMDYAHGTGHGVGSFLNVHEYPPLIGSRDGQQLLPGMFFSIEPGYYEEGLFGIRIETIFTVVEAQTEHRNRNRTFFKFNPVVFVPFEPNLIVTEMLTEEQIKWLNDYNAKTINTVGVELRKQGKQRALKWLTARTEYIKPKGTGDVTRPSMLPIFSALLFALSHISKELTHF